MYNAQTGKLHKSSCGNCFMTFKGYEKQSWTGGERSNWWGPFATAGAAIDTAHYVNFAIEGCADCCSTMPYLSSK